MPNTLRITNYLERKYCIKRPFNKNKILKIDETSMVFPSYYFCTPEKGKKNYSIHHFNGSWIDTWHRKEILKLGKYCVVKYKKKKLDRDEEIKMREDERVIFKFTRDCIRKYFLLEQDDLYLKR